MKFPLHTKIIALKRYNIIYLTEGSFKYSLSENNETKKNLNAFNCRKLKFELYPG